MKRAEPLLGLLLGLLCLLAAGARAQEFSFDASAFDRKTLELGGYAELKRENHALRRDGAFYQLNFYDRLQRDSLERNIVTLKPSGKLRLGEDASLNLRASLDEQRDSLSVARNSRFDEVYLSYKPAPGFTLDAGKTALKWGKGYAWNPVGFVERPKDPNDPELAREGFTVLAADYIRNFDGPLQTLAVTPLVLPVSRGINSDFGRPGHVNVAGKVYLLYRDTDIDLMFENSGSRSRRFGFDFSRNFGSSLELHGEWARVRRAARVVTDERGNTNQVQADATSYLAGARYLSARETTYIVEYYRNGGGYSETQATDFYRFVDAGMAQYNSTGSSALLKKASTIAQGGYARPNAGRNYAYFRVSQKEPFDILYFTPAVTVIGNLDDRSRSVAPEMLYTGFSNIELRLRAILLSGRTNSEFGEKQNSRRIELLARIYF